MREKLRRFTIVFAGSLMLAGSAACATGTYQYRPNRTDGYYQQAGRRAYDNGYREGLERGRDDARRRRAFSFERYDEYRNADRGYRRGDGIGRDQYRQMYRDGFRAGYTQSYQRIGR
jgi:hypothetical protein